jgi:hypothetical protein
MSLAEKVSQITQGDLKRYTNISNTELSLNETGLYDEMSRRGGQIWTVRDFPLFRTAWE